MGSRAEETLATQLDAIGIKYGREVKLYKTRRYRWDFLVKAPGIKQERRRLSHLRDLLVEVQGGVFMAGGHSTGTGITRDCEKLALALVAGYRQLNVTTAHVMSGDALKWIEAIVSGYVPDEALAKAET